MRNDVASAIAFFAFGANLLGTMLLLLFNPRHREIRWFTAFQVAIMTWLLAQAMVFETGSWRVWGYPHLVAVSFLPGLFLASALVEDKGRKPWVVWLAACSGIVVFPIMLQTVTNEQWYWSALTITLQALGWGLGATIMFRRSLMQTPRHGGTWTTQRITLLALLLLVPVAVAAATVADISSFFIYALPIITVGVQLLLFIGVARMRFYDIDVRVQRTGEMAAQAAESERLAVLGELAASLAHEVRNPLTGMRSLTQRIAEEDIAPDKRRRYAEVILEEIARLERIVGNLLGVARRTSWPQRQAEPTALQPLFEDLVLLVGAPARTARVSLESDAGGLTAHAPREALAQALLNLLLNAVRHSPPLTTVHLLARSTEQGTELLVRDAGPGVPLAERERIFEPFHTTGNGTGLGLSVVRSLARELGWQLRVGDSVQGGAEFVIVVPAAATAAIGAAV